MKVLYVVFKALLGGHVLSASSVAQAMRNWGVQPVFAASPGPMAQEIRKKMPFEEVEIPLFHGSIQTYFTWRSLAAVKRLRRIIREREIDLVHAFDSRSYVHVYLAGLLERVPVTCTLCGGIDPYYNLPVAPSIMVFCNEQKQRMLKRYRWPDHRVQVVRTRLDVKTVLGDKESIPHEEAELELDPKLPKIMMISRADDTKIRSILFVLDTMERLFQRGTDFQFVLIGGEGNRQGDVARRFETLRSQYGEGRLVFTGPVFRAYRLLRRATLVLGAGRSAFEGMIYGKPVLVVGERGYAGTISAGTVDDIGFYNFSGRNQTVDVPPETLADEIAHLLAHAELRERLGRFGRDFVMREIDVEQGTQRIAEVYRRLINPANRLPRSRQWLSFLACLVPIARDNAWESLKWVAKGWFQLRRLQETERA